MPIPRIKGPKDYATLVGEYIPEAERLLGLARKPYIYDLNVYNEVSATAVELSNLASTTALSVQNGGSYTKIAVLSASTDDNTSGTAQVAAFIVLGIDATHNYNFVTVAPSGVTSASGATALYEIAGAWPSLYGTSDQNCAGSCMIAMIGKVSKEVISFATSTNHANHGKIWAPPGWRAKIINCQGFFISSTDSDSRANIFPLYYDAYAAAVEDGSDESVYFGGEGAELDFNRVYGNDTTVWKLSLYAKVAGGTETVGAAVRVMLWAEPDRLITGQFKNMIGE